MWILNVLLVLIQAVVGYHFFKKQETLKKEQQKELEEEKGVQQRQLATHTSILQNHFQMIVREHESRFSLLQQKRCDIAGELYAKTASVVRIMQSITSVVLLSPSEEERKIHEKKLTERYFQATDDLREMFDQNRVFLLPSTCEHLDALFKKLWFIEVDYGQFQKWQGSDLVDDLTAKLWKSVQNGRTELDGILKQIETELRDHVNAVAPEIGQWNRPSLPDPNASSLPPSDEK